MKFTINTTPMPDGTIAQEVISDCGLNDMKERMFSQVIRTQDVEIEKALKSLGWVPPRESAALRADACRYNWLKYQNPSNHDGYAIGLFDTCGVDAWQMTTNDIDAAIDAAMKGKA